MTAFAIPMRLVAILALGALVAIAAQAQETPAVGSSKALVDTSAGFPRGDWYPPQARRKNMEGEVLVSFTLDATGSPRDVQATSEGHWKVLEAAAIGLVKHLKFHLPTAWTEDDGTRHQFKVQFDICPFTEPPKGPVEVESLTIRACRAP